MEEEKIKKVAVFIDYDNVHICLEDSSKMIDVEGFNIFREIGEKYGKVISVKPYAVWDFLYDQQKAFEEIGIRPIPIFSKLKNATDITLAVECLGSAFRDGIDVFVLFTGDGGYAPLVNFLIDDLDKEVYLYSVKNGAHQKAYRRLKENHFWIDEELKEHIIENTHSVINSDHIQLVKILHHGLKTHDFIARKKFFTFIVEREEFKHLGKEGCGKLLDQAISLRLINNSLKDNPYGPHPTRIITVNYEHPKVKELDLR